MKIVDFFLNSEFFSNDDYKRFDAAILDPAAIKNRLFTFFLLI